MADFAEIIKKHAGEDGNIPAAAIQTLVTAISNAVGNEYVAKERYKEKLNEIDELTGKLQTAEDSVTTAEKWKTKYEAMKEDFTNFKAEQAKKDTRAAKETAYRALLKAAGVSEKRMESVLRVSDVDGVELNDKGEITDAKKRMESIKEEWADFIETTEVQGAETPNPINNTGDHMMSIEDIDKITDTAARQTAMAQNLGLFGIK